MKDLTDPSNRDSVPAMLTPGEFVLNKEASNMFKPQIEEMNDAGLQQRAAENAAHRNMGGMIPGYNAGGSLPTLPTQQFNSGGQAGFFAGDDWDKYSNTVGQIESGNKYDIRGGSNDHYVGKYQLGSSAIKDAAKRLGIKAPSKEALQANPDLQEKLFRSYTEQNHEYLMKKQPERYGSLSPRQQQEALGYAHNQGAGGASKWLATGEVGSDAFGTKGTKYSDALAGAWGTQTGQGGQPGAAGPAGQYQAAQQPVPQQQAAPPEQKASIFDNFSLSNPTASLAGNAIGSLVDNWGQSPEENTMRYNQGGMIPPVQELNIGGWLKGLFSGGEEEDPNAGYAGYTPEQFVDEANAPNSAAANSGFTVPGMNPQQPQVPEPGGNSGVRGPVPQLPIDRFGQQAGALRGQMEMGLNAPSPDGVPQADQSAPPPPPPGADAARLAVTQKTAPFSDVALETTRPEDIQIVAEATADQQKEQQAGEDQAMGMPVPQGGNQQFPFDSALSPEAAAQYETQRAEEEVMAQPIPQNDLGIAPPIPEPGIEAGEIEPTEADLDAEEARYNATQGLQQTRLDQSVAAEGPGQDHLAQVAAQQEAVLAEQGLSVPEIDAAAGVPKAKADPNTILEANNKRAEATRIIQEADATVAEGAAEIENATSVDQIKQAQAKIEKAKLDAEAAKKSGEEADVELATVQAKDEAANESRQNIIDHQQKAVDEARTKARQEAGLAPKPDTPEVVEKITESVTEITTAAEEEGESPISGQGTNGDEGATSEEVTTTGNGASPAEKDFGVSAVKEAFGDLFDKGEVARMGVLFAGALLTGASPAQSLAFAGKSYLQRVDAKNANHKKRVFDLSKGGKHTKESIKAFQESGDPTDLMETAVPPKRTGEFKEFFGSNGAVKAEKVTVNGTTKWVDGKGNIVNQYNVTDDPARSPYTTEGRAVMQTEGREYAGIIKEAQGLVIEKNKGTDFQGANTGITPNLAGNEAAAWAMKNGLKPAGMGRLLSNAFESAQRDGKSAKSIVPYLNEQYVQAEVGDSTNFKMGNGKVVEAQKTGQWLGSVSNSLKGKYPDTFSNMSTSEISAFVLNSKAGKDWNNFDEKTKAAYIKKGADLGYSGWMFYINQQL